MWILLAYVGPETVLPVASILVAALGFLLAAWSWILRGVKRGVLFCLGRSPKHEAQPPSDAEPTAAIPERRA